MFLKYALNKLILCTKYMLIPLHEVKMVNVLYVEVITHYLCFSHNKDKYEGEDLG